MTSTPTNEDPGITALLRRIENERDDHACDLLWQTYFDRVIRIAQKRLYQFSSRDTAEDDVALSAMNSFFRAAENGALTSVQDRDGLWRFLATIAARKARAANRRNSTERRGEGNVVVFTDLEATSTEAEKTSNVYAIDCAGDAAFVGQLLLECEERVKSLPSERLQRIAILRMEGYELEEIAARIGLSRSAISNKLKLIRELWTHSAQDLPS